MFAGILALGLNYGAYMTEIFRAGILAVGPGQTEAADALGMSYRQRMRRVVLPQAFKVIIPPTGNEFIAMIKDTALLSFVASAIFWYDIFKRATVVGAAISATSRPSSSLPRSTGLLTGIFTFFQSSSRRRISKGYVREGAARPRPGRTRFVTGAPDRRRRYRGRDARPGRCPPRRSATRISRRSRPSGRRSGNLVGGPVTLTTANGEPVVRVKNLRKSFGSLEVLKGIDMEVQKAEVVVIFGRSGSGKSTLLRCINFLEDPTEGTIEVAGIHLAGGHRSRHKREEIRKLRMRAGMVFQDFQLFPHMTAIQNVMEGRSP